MDFMKNWNKIVELFEQHKSSSEAEIQKLWENIFPECFGYSKLSGEISSQEKIHIGSTDRTIPDLVIKNGSERLFVVELKRKDLPASKDFKQQLISYLKLLDLHIGILICNKIFIVNISDDKETEICFSRENPDGAKFMELFHKENFNENKIKEFISQKIRSAQNIKYLREEIENSKERIIKLLENEFAPKYGKAEFDEVMKEFDIQIVKKVPAAVFAPKAHGAIVHAPLAGKEKKGDFDKLQKYIQTVGMSTFVKHYEQFANPNFDTRDVKQVMRHNNETWGYNSFNTKASAGKWITNNGYGEEALKRIAGADKTDSETIQKARVLLEKYF